MTSEKHQLERSYKGLTDNNEVLKRENAETKEHVDKASQNGHEIILITVRLLKRPRSV